MKSKIPCEIIKDLLPLYVDELTSEVTDKEVELHVSECEDCSKSLQTMKNPDVVMDEEEEKEIKFLQKNKRANRRVVVSVIAVSVVVVALISVFLYKRTQVKFEMASFGAEAVPGDTFLFGEYEQDGNLENGPEPIEWIVLQNKLGKIYAMSKYGLDCKPYHHTKEAVTWETCSLREWMNGEFYEMAFTSDEKELIADTTLINSDNPYYYIDGGNNTVDKVFLISYNEVSLYSAGHGYIFEHGLCMPTVYAKNQGVYVDTRWITQCEWWLRTIGINESSATIGTKEGSSGIGYSVDYKTAAVRPCINIEYKEVESQ